jgi:sigma-E factor negative regulatory protein RseA
MDGEIRDTDNQALDGWSRDEGLRAAWGRYHLISECMRGTLPRHMDPALASRIAVALRQEPAILAPDVAAPRPWLKPLAGMAIAASVATLAVVGIQMNRQQDPGAGFGASVAGAAASSGSGGQVNLASGNNTPRLQRPADGVRTEDPRLDRYLINYAGQRGGAAVPGVPPHVRVLKIRQEQEQQQ